MQHLKHLETEQKALEINLDNSIYGSFAEIGAGQEVARYFFTVGAAAGTIAKSISAYDKTVSDDVYGREPTGRYVCESRVYRMLDHEYELMLDRLSSERPDACLFAFADTVSTINFHRTTKGHGWMGLRFQHAPHSEPNDIVIHVEMKDGNANLQQQAVGILGVNLIYACYRYSADYKTLIASLMDKLQDRVSIDAVSVSGPLFRGIDNRLLCLELVRQGLTNVTVFDKKGHSVHISEFLYKKNLLVVRGNFRPTTLLSMEMIRAASAQFRTDMGQNSTETFVSTELTLESLSMETGTIDNQDYLDRVDLLNYMGQAVMLTNCDNYLKLIHYLKDYRIGHLGLVMEARPLLNLLNGKYERNKDGRLLTSFGEIFTRGVTTYVFPELREGSGELLDSKSLPIAEGLKYLYRHLLEHGHIVDVCGFNESLLSIRSAEVLRKIREDETGWEQLVHEKVERFIRDKGLFNFPMQKMEFEY
jgi:hypothetical protein